MMTSPVLYIRTLLLKRYWRRHNLQNHTWIGNVRSKATIPFIKGGGIVVGKRTYGPINIHYTLGDKERLIIGSNCSIGDCDFLLGGGHDYRCITTYPLFGSGTLQEITKGPIIIEDDVWIGNAAWILSGVRVGKGAVVGTGSIVTRNVPPYAIVAGNPARIIKYRFSKSIIDKIKDISLNEDQYTQEQIDLIYTHLTEENVLKVIERIQG